MIRIKTRISGPQATRPTELITFSSTIPFGSFWAGAHFRDSIYLSLRFTSLVSRIGPAMTNGTQNLDPFYSVQTDRPGDPPPFLFDGGFAGFFGVTEADVGTRAVCQIGFIPGVVTGTSACGSCRYSSILNGPYGELSPANNQAGLGPAPTCPFTNNGMPIP